MNELTKEQRSNLRMAFQSMSFNRATVNELMGAVEIALSERKEKEIPEVDIKAWIEQNKRAIAAGEEFIETQKKEIEKARSRIAYLAHKEQV